MTSCFASIPRRIFLDTNVLQYLQDFGEYIFDHYQENENFLLSLRGKRIEKDNPLYLQIVALGDLFLGISRTNLEFALSESVYREVVQKKNSEEFLQWFYEMWDYWQNILNSYDKELVSKRAKRYYGLAKDDKSLLGNLSVGDKKIVLDAIRLDCNALLTVDKFANNNFQKFIFKKYKLMVLHPTDLMEVIRPFRALWY